MKLRLIALAALSVALAGCHKTATAPVPGSLNQFDATSYRALVDAQSSLHRIKTQQQCTVFEWPATAMVDGLTEPCDQTKGTFPAGQQSKDDLNRAIQDYNIAQAAWHAYHAGATNDEKGLADAISQLNNDLTALFTKLGGK